jgi:hypothetical protein
VGVLDAIGRGTVIDSDPITADALTPRRRFSRHALMRLGGAEEAVELSGRAAHRCAGAAREGRRRAA